MTRSYNLHRFGLDEFAVGHLINGTMPDDEDERWAIVEAPKIRIEQLLDQHLQAQAALRNCRRVGRPFLLFLRSFSTEYDSSRIGTNVTVAFSTASIDFQKWLKRSLGQALPTIRLHGGSDTMPGTPEDGALVLSTHSANWEAVAAELVQAAAAIVFLISDVSPGVSKELDLIRRFGQMNRCVVILADPRDTPGHHENLTSHLTTLIGAEDGPGLDLAQSRLSGFLSRPKDASGRPTTGLSRFLPSFVRRKGSSPGPELSALRSRLPDFPNTFVLKDSARGAGKYPKEAASVLRKLVQCEGSATPLEHSLAAPFSYVEPDFIDSDHYVATEKFIWHNIRVLRALVHVDYWDALDASGIAMEDFGVDLSDARRLAHKIHGLAIATGDFHAICESLSLIMRIHSLSGLRIVMLYVVLARAYAELASKVHPEGCPDTESRYGAQNCPLDRPATHDDACWIHNAATLFRERGHAKEANYFYQSAVICALGSSDVMESERRDLVVTITRNWVKFLDGVNEHGWANMNRALAARHGSA